MSHAKAKDPIPKPADPLITAALIGVVGVLLAAVVGGIFLFGVEWWKHNLPQEPPKTTPVVDTGKPKPRKKTKPGYCQEDPVTKIKYTQSFTFNPYDHMVQPLVTLGGDGVNPGHKWEYKPEAPGPVYHADCSHGGTHEEILQCGAESSNSKNAMVMGWINGAGGPTTITVYYEVPCDVLDDRPD
jgi:hypothetical protein